MQKQHKPRVGTRLAQIAGCFALLVIVLGAYTRLVDAGLGCPDWPGCYGHLMWPDEHHEIVRAEQLYPHAPVKTDKTWPEMVHRYLAGILGLMIICLAWLGWKNREDSQYPFRLPFYLLFFVVWQALFGMWTVTLKLWPQVVTIHLLGGVTTYSLLWILALRLNNYSWELGSVNREAIRKTLRWAIPAIVIVTVQILLGGWTSSNYAAFACPDFPQCHSSWWPAHMDFREGFNIFQSIGPNYLGGQMENDARVAIHFTHRLGALITAIYLVLFATSLIKHPLSRLKPYGWTIVGLLLLQLTLGVSNILFMVPLPVAVAHNAVAALLLMSLVVTGTRLWMALPRLEKDDD